MSESLQGQNKIIADHPENMVTLYVDVAGGVGWATRESMHYHAETDTYYYSEVDGHVTNYYLATEVQINDARNRAGVIGKIEKAKGIITSVDTESVSEDSQVFNLGEDDANDAPYLRLAQSQIKEGNDRKIVPAARGGSGGKGGESLRYPNSEYYEKDADYVMFEFGKYIPPFLPNSKQVMEEADGKLTNKQLIPTRYQNYNRSASDFKPIMDDAGFRPIIMYMPQDISSEVKTSWNLKAFSNMGKDLISSANGKFNNIKEYNVPEGIKSTFAGLFTNAINAIPGVGGNLALNDVTGSTRGVILNPNVEVLFDQPDLREFGLKFKMTPHNAEEAKIIRSICRTFTRASLPGFGDTSHSAWMEKGKSNNKKTSIGKGNMIEVPHQCRVSFMKGKSLHPYLTQYKTCAITRVQVNYTPDGNYSTYEDGAPVATELSLDFLETKLLFRQDISNSTASL